MNDKKKRLFGIIHIGSVAMTLWIISYSGLDDMEVIENVSREVDYGEEVFQTNHISFESLNDICHILCGFRQLLRDYSVEEINTIATTAIREADNNLKIIDQILVRTGFKVTVIDMTKEIYYKFFGLYYLMQRRHINFSDRAVLLMDISSGGLGVTGWQSGKLLFQQNVHSGALRILENFDKKLRNELTFPAMIREYIHGTLFPVWEIVQHHHIKYIILSGLETDLISDLMGKKKTNGMCLIKPQTFIEFVDSFNGVTPFKLMQRYQMPESKANVITPTILLYYELLHVINADVILFMGTSFVEGYSMFYVAEKENDVYIRRQHTLLLDFARTIAAKYLSDPSHSVRIEQFGSVIFHAMYKLIGVKHKMIYLLRLAAILHESGKFINMRGHCRYTYELIMATEFFGITEEEKKIVANIGYYSYSGVPCDNDENYRSLTASQKITVIKLAAIFRLSDALDIGHNGKINRIAAEVRERELIVSYFSDFDISLERWAFKKATVNFEEVFGITPILKKG